MKPLVIYIDMDGVLCDYPGAFKAAIDQNPNISFPQSQYGFFRNLAPLEGAIEAFHFLNSQSIFDVYILTAPSVKNPLCYTEKSEWVAHHLGSEMLNRLIISPNKGLSKGNYLIDDHETGRGQEHFEGTLIHFGSIQFENWENVISYFKNKYKL